MKYYDYFTRMYEYLKQGCGSSQIFADWKRFDELKEAGSENE